MWHAGNKFYLKSDADRKEFMAFTLVLLQPTDAHIYSQQTTSCQSECLKPNTRPFAKVAVQKLFTGN